MSPAKPQKFIVYLRVSTAKQGRSGLGLEAQQQAVTDYLSGVPGAKVVSTFKEIESGKNSERPKLLEALHMCKLTGSRLLIAKLDRLSREIAFITTLQTGRVKFVCADMPDANDLTIHVIAAIAQHERKMISERTTAALAAAKPPIFFKRKPALLDQLRKFAMKDLLEIQEAFSSAIFQSRKLADLGETTINRTLLAIARLARSKSN